MTEGDGLRWAQLDLGDVAAGSPGAAALISWWPTKRGPVVGVVSVSMPSMTTVAPGAEVTCSRPRGRAMSP